MLDGMKSGGRSTMPKGELKKERTSMVDSMSNLGGRSGESSMMEQAMYINGQLSFQTDKWAEDELGTKWGDKWEESFIAGIGSRQGETWCMSPTNERWSRTWGEEHSGDGKVHKFGRSTTGERCDIVVEEDTNYEPVPHYGWAEVVGDSAQLLSIKPREKPPGMFPEIDIGSSSPPSSDNDDQDQSPSQ